MIGRSKEANVVLFSRKVSRVHCVISIQGDGPFTLADLHSTNGTRINDQLIDGKVVTLQPYDRIAIGEAQFVFKLH
ncbi:MAG: hypothetical protein PCFJNLEI_03193 [Verrucomicrobiae bacterium]|nr:hypothetical protein [Verrucomicrobiae bacterium]